MRIRSWNAFKVIGDGFQASMVTGCAPPAIQRVPPLDEELGQNPSHGPIGPSERSLHK